MIYKITLAFILTVTLSAVQAQSTEAPAKTGRPDIPGSFVVEYGFNRDLTGPDNFSLYFWGSRTVNLYYQYEMRILKSRFSFVPGIGLSLERYRFKNNRILAFDNADSLMLIPAITITAADTIATFVPTGTGNSKLITNFIEIPLEFRYTSKPDDPARAFKMSIGGRIGYLYDSFSKVKYKQGGEVKTFKDKQDFNLNKLRYGVSAKIGFGNFSIFAYYNLTDLFQKNKGLYYEGTQYNFPTGTIGFSLSSF